MGVERAVVGAAAVITMNWTEQRNSLGLKEANELTQAIRDVRASNVDSVILTGNGAFCAGGKLDEFAQLSAEFSPSEIRQRIYGVMQDIIRALMETPVPTIAAIDGPAVGLGMDIALACDMRFVGPAGWLAQGWARAGLVAGTGGTAMLHALRPELVWRLIAEQSRMDMDDCANSGLAEKGTPDALTVAQERAESLTGVGREALTGYVQLTRSLRRPSDEHLVSSAALQGSLIGSQRFRDTAAQLLGGLAQR
jgi:enoyl-CoA hydratase/carnithine racemase